MSGNSGEFKLSITRALTDQLEDALAALTPAPLTLGALAALQARPGVYQLFHNGALVYVGKASESLPDRMSNHYWKVSGRTNIRIEDMTFACLYVDEDMDAVAPETQLIKRYRQVGEVPWNTNGFGNNDPGRERDTSAVKANHFDALYPIDLGWDCERINAGDWPLHTLLLALKAELPYVFRFQKVGRARTASHPDYDAAVASVPMDGMEAAELLELVVDALPSEWLATALPGYVILYKERPKTYLASIAQW